MKNVYFISDAHLGSLATAHRRTQERRLVRFLDEIRDHAAALYLLGDMFDFWYEYRYVVPKGYTRFLGKISELTDSGVEVHFFTGNHDLWLTDYLEKECGMIIHRDAMTTEIYGKLFFLCHGDGVGRRTRSFRILRAVFHSSICRTLFSALHPRWAIPFGLNWARHSREKRVDGKEVPFMGADHEPEILFARKYLSTHPDINYFIFGHRHIEADISIAEHSRVVILGEWLTLFTYACFDGEELYLEDYIEGETHP